MQLSLFESRNADIALDELFEAYFACRHNKRNTINALSFESNYEDYLVELHRQINDGSYKVGRSIAFVVDKPVKREIFATDFRDRVVHHLIIHKLSPLLDKEFIFDSYACRKGKGTLFGIRRVNRFIRQCSHNYQRDCYVLKLDIESFFMHINKNLLFDRINDFVLKNYIGNDRDKLIALIKKVVFNNPTRGCIITGRNNNWEGLPANKSLFNAVEGCGMPIGNLTSQVFANFYMTKFDHWMKKDLGIRFYGRYVDDFICVHQDKAYLTSIVPLIRNYLQKELRLTLHPNKIYLQHYSLGVKYLGAVIKPYRLYIGNRTVSNYLEKIKQQNLKVEKQKQPSQELQNKLISSLNSYLGLMQHYQSFKIRSSTTSKLADAWWLSVSVSNQCRKFIKSEYLGAIPVESDSVFSRNGNLEEVTTCFTDVEHITRKMRHLKKKKK